MGFTVMCSPVSQWYAAECSTVSVLEKGKRTEHGRGRRLSVSPAPIAFDPLGREALKGSHSRAFSTFYFKEPTTDSDLQPLRAKSVVSMHQLESTPQEVNHSASSLCNTVVP